MRPLLLPLTILTLCLSTLGLGTAHPEGDPLVPDVGGLLPPLLPPGNDTDNGTNETPHNDTWPPTNHTPPPPPPVPQHNDTDGHNETHPPQNDTNPPHNGTNGTPGIPPILPPPNGEGPPGNNSTSPPCGNCTPPPPNGTGVPASSSSPAAAPPREDAVPLVAVDAGIVVVRIGGGA